MGNPKLYYTFSGLQDDLHKHPEEHGPRFLEQGGTASSCWFSNLPVNVSWATIGRYIPSIRNFITELLTLKSCGDKRAKARLKGTLATAKTCPGVRGVLENSILLKAPCDISILVTKEGSWQSYILPECSALLDIKEGHPPEQLSPMKGQNPFENKKVLKFSFPMHVCTKGTPWLFLQPQYHNTLDYQVINGLISGVHTKVQELNLITVVEQRDYNYTINIKEGDVLAYLWSPKPLTLEYQDTPYPTRIDTHFIGNFT